MGLIIQARPPDMGSWRVLEELLFNGVPVEPGDGAQPAGPGGAGASPSFQLRAGNPTPLSTWAIRLRDGEIPTNDQ
jgi:hypothetical protein